MRKNKFLYDFKHLFTITDEAEQIVRQRIEDMCANPNCYFANARTIQHIFTAITSAAQVRVAQQKAYDKPVQITAEDVQSFTWKHTINAPRIGFE